MARYEYDTGYVTDKGNVRRINQDSILVKKGKFDRKEFILAAVADGMGGMDRGELASSEIMRGLNQWWTQTLPNCFNKTGREEFMEQVSDSLSCAIEACNSRILMMAETDKIRTGSTLSVMFLYDGMFVMKQIGDSRIYLYEKDSSVRQLTRDQTWCQEEVEKGDLLPEEVRGHRMEHVLTNAVGHDYQLKVESAVGAMAGSMQIVLCSDGAYRFLDQESMRDILGLKKTCQEKAEEALRKIKRTKADDNCSIIFIRQERRWW